jgi:hypothetical protein
MPENVVEMESEMNAQPAAAPAPAEDQDLPF